MKSAETWFPSLAPAPRRAASGLAFCIFNIALLIPLAAPAVTPYEAIVGRNVFGLKPPTVVPTVTEEPAVPAPKIRLQGLTTILGRRQVLFKASLPAKPGEPAREQASVLSEGDREGEITVLEIDELNGTVKFNNYGYVMTLNMKDDADKPPATAAVPAGLPQPGVVPPPGLSGLPVPKPFSAPPPGVPMPGNIPSRSLRTSPTGAGVPGASLGGNTTAHTPTPTGPPLSQEEQEVLIEVRRQQYKDQGDPTALVMPPTSMTPSKEPVPSPQP